MNDAPSMLHVKLVPPESDVKVKFADVETVVPIGGDVRYVSGSGGSTTVHDSAAGVGSAPVAFFARTWNVCEPFASVVMSFGLEQPAKAAPSRLHSNVALPWFEAKVKVPVLTAVVEPIGSDVIVVSGSGRVDATVHVSVAGVGSGLAPVHGAHLERVRAGREPVAVKLDVQAVNAPASTLHWNVAPARFVSKPNVAEEDVVAPIGTVVSAVFGGFDALAVKASSSGAAVAAFSR